MDDELWWSTLLAARKDMYSTEDERYVAYGVWQDRPSYGDGVPTATSWWRNSIGGINHQTVVAPKVARSAAANPIREHPPVWNKGADTANTPSREDSAQADAYTDVLADDWSQAEFSLGRHRREREVVLSPRRLTGAAVFLAGQKRSAVADEWRSHLSDLIRQGLSSRDQTPAACGFLWAALRYRLRDAADLACGPVDALLRSRTLSNLLVLIPTLMAALYILRHLGTLGVVTSAEGISAIGAALHGLVRVGRWWRDVKPPEPKARCAKEQ